MSMMCGTSQKECDRILDEEMLWAGPEGHQIAKGAPDFRPTAKIVSVPHGCVTNLLCK